MRTDLNDLFKMILGESLPVQPALPEHDMEGGA